MNPILHVQLADPKSVIKNKPKLLTKANIGRLTIKLANESYFAPHLLDTCTVHGNRDLPALPKDKLQSLKKFLCTTNPEFIGSQVVFEAHWKVAVDALNQHMAGRRRQLLKKEGSY